MTFTPMWQKVMNSLRPCHVRVCIGHRATAGGSFVRPFTLNYALPSGQSAAVPPYHFDVSLQLNVLPDGRPAVSDRALLMATGTTTSTAGSQTHFDD